MKIKLQRIKDKVILTAKIKVDIAPTEIDKHHIREKWVEEIVKTPEELKKILCWIVDHDVNIQGVVDSNGNDL